LLGETHTGGSDDFDPSMLIKTFDDTAPIHAVKSVKFNGSDYQYEYDGNGNMTKNWDFSHPAQPVERQIDYNADNMPYNIKHLRSSGTVEVDLKYDGAGMRVKKSNSDGSTTYYIGDHFEVADGAEIKYIFAGNLRIAKVTTTEKQFYHKDHLGSSTVITSYSDGSVIESAEYIPFGLIRKQTGTQVTYYEFSDQEIDTEVGLYSFNARLYDPAIGIFISPDSIVPDFTNPQSLNRYSYCYNNPLAYVDPSGHFGFLASIVAGAVIGAISAGAQSDWDPGTMAVGALIGGVSGGVFSGVSGVAGSYISHIGLAGGMGPPTAGMMTAGGIGGAIVGGAAGGAAAGGLGAAYYGGDIGQSTLQGAGYGALSGAAFGGIGSYFGKTWNLWRVGAYTLSGGGISTLAGQGFENGAIYAGAIAFARFTYNEITGYDVRWQNGEGYQAKGRYTLPNDPTLCHIGEQGTAMNGKFWHDFLLERGWLSRTTNYIPGVNATAVLHDVMQVKLDQWLGNLLGQAGGSFARSVLNVPNMIPAAIITTAGLSAGPQAMVLYTTNPNR
jgi:RHS repeat-associated protein